MADHHTCDRCGNEIDGYSWHDHGVWIGRHAAELCNPCKQVVETALWGRPLTLIDPVVELGFWRAAGRWLLRLVGWT